jgi:peptidoglycan/xylan/chitin deacetylase (PgdA/CDA1 family)
MQVPILMYHSVANVAPPALQTWTVTRAQFAAQMAWLHAQGFAALTVSGLVRLRQTGAGLPTRPVVLTFDDGYADFLSAALPIMAQYGFASTLYVTTGFVEAQRHLFGTQPAILSWAQLREVQQSTLVEIGAHTHDHSPLDRLSPTDMQREVVTPKQKLEQHLGQPVESFCYPFGFNNASVRAQVKGAGYTSACAIYYRMSGAIDPAFALSRFLVADTTDLNEFSQIVTGRGPRTRLLFQQARSTAWRVIRQALPKVPLHPISASAPQ